jgi:hypothetical protein
VLDNRAARISASEPLERLFDPARPSQRRCAAEQGSLGQAAPPTFEDLHRPVLADPHVARVHQRDECDSLGNPARAFEWVDSKSAHLRAPAVANATPRVRRHQVSDAGARQAQVVTNRNRDVQLDAVDARRPATDQPPANVEAMNKGDLIVCWRAATRGAAFEDKRRPLSTAHRRHLDTDATLRMPPRHGRPTSEHGALDRCSGRTRGSRVRECHGGEYARDKQSDAEQSFHGRELSLTWSRCGVPVAIAPLLPEPLLGDITAVRRPATSAPRDSFGSRRPLGRNSQTLVDWGRSSDCRSSFSALRPSAGASRRGPGGLIGARWCRGAGRPRGRGRTQACDLVVLGRGDEHGEQCS